jgi:hypothetical protein
MALVIQTSEAQQLGQQFTALDDAVTSACILTAMRRTTQVPSAQTVKDCHPIQGFGLP